MFSRLKMLARWADFDNDKYEEQIKDKAESIAAPKNNDGATEVEINDNSPASSWNSLTQQFYSTDQKISTTKQLVNTYRGLMNNHEVENAVQNIVNDAIVFEDGHDVVSLNLEATGFSESVKERIHEEFKDLLNTIQFDRRGQDMFRRWYVDSRIFFHKIIGKNPKDGIIELRQLDPRNLEYVREIITEDTPEGKIYKATKEYFIYTVGNSSYCAGGQVFSPNSRVKIPRSAITYAHSGLMDCDDKYIIGYLHRAVKPANQLKLLEDAMVVYRITRAPERRVFFIDTGNMNNRKAAQHMNSVAQSFKNRVVYDASTGKLKNQQANLSMTEDYWLQRRDGKAITDVTTLPGASGMSDIDDIRYFNRKLYEALRVPLSRSNLSDANMVIGGDGSEITRDELEFSKFIRTLQSQFSEVLRDPLKYNLILKNVITEDDWDREINNIKVVFHRDSYYTEVKDAEILERRIGLIERITPYIGKYFSNQTVMRDILKYTDDQMDTEKKQIEEEANDPRFKQTPDEIEDF